MLAEIIACGFVVGVLIIIAGFIWMRHDNAINHREELRTQRAMVSGAPSYNRNYEQDRGILGEFGPLLKIIMDNPELVQKFLGKKEEGQ